MAGDQDHPRRLRGIAAAHHSVDVSKRRGLHDAGAGRGSRLLDEAVAVNFETAVTGRGNFFELRFDPVRGGDDTASRRQVFVQAGQGTPVMERDKRGNRMLNLRGRNLRERVGDGRVRKHGADGGSNGIQIAVGSACGRAGLRLGGQKRGKEQSAGQEAIKLHDYRVCRKLGHESTLDAGAILLKTTGGWKDRTGRQPSEPDSANCRQHFSCWRRPCEGPVICSPGGGIHDLP